MGPGSFLRCENARARFPRAGNTQFSSIAMIPANGAASRAPGAWHLAEAVQLRKHSSVRAGARWEIALARDGRIVGAIKHVRLRRG